jgi:hypothetical protein
MKKNGTAATQGQDVWIRSPVSMEPEQTVHLFAAETPEAQVTPNPLKNAYIFFKFLLCISMYDESYDKVSLFVFPQKF